MTCCDAALSRPSPSASWPWLGAMVLLWGLSWPATQMALGEMPPLWLATFRFGSAAICLLAFLALRGRLVLPVRADLPIIASIGLLQMMTFTGLGMIAMTQTDTSHSVLLAYTTPLWSTLLAWLALGERPRRAQLGALAIGLAGVALICSPLETDWQRPGAFMGAGFLLTGAVCWSAVILHVRRHRWQTPPLALAPWQMLLATLPLGAIALLREGVPQGIGWSLPLVELLVFIGPVATSACFVISAEHGRRISSFAMANVTLGVPVIGVAGSVAFLGNQLSPVFLAGLALVMAGIVLTARAAASR
ncbi:DMT family transporter [Poseidonocella sp. HB161398]|uniref:DMT family transporter n=1 Tax=Poseidonocella sp. HB161398 TaxID=2320855 RepID=UPI001F116503|nr:DMT family transporter [Poseidonocella sp. HB161398]